jgi:septal ring factor EnvC (AmiA/AmiB activator)
MSDSTTPGLLDRLRTRFSQSAASVEQAQAEANKAQRELARTEEEFNRLTAEYERASAEIEHAEKLCVHRKQQLQQTEQTMLDAWGQNGPHGGPNYSVTVSDHAAIADFPRVREHLAKRLEAAQRTLKDFERKHSL